MGLIARIQRVTMARIQSFLDSVEDPEIMFPQLVAEIYNAFVAGDLERARQAQARLAPLRIAFDLGTFPVVIKEALALMGICSAHAKAPVKPMADTRRAELKLVLQNLGVL